MKFLIFSIFFISNIGLSQDIKKAFLSIGYEFKDGQKYFKKLSLDYTDVERIKMKDITHPNLYCWSNDIEEIENLLLDIINGKITIERARKMIKFNTK